MRTNLGTRVERLRDIADAGERFAALTSFLNLVGPELRQLQDERAKALAQVPASYSDLAERFGMTRSRVQQLVEKGRRLLRPCEVSELARSTGREGGLKRAATLSAERRREIAMLGVEARRAKSHRPGPAGI